MRVTLQTTGPSEALATFTLPNGERLTVPLQAVPGSHAGRWVDGRLVEAQPVGAVLDSLLATAPAAA